MRNSWDTNSALIRVGRDNHSSTLRNSLRIPISSFVLLWTKVLLLIIAAFLIRPTALGQQYTTLGLLLECLALLLYLFEFLLGKRISISKNSLILIACGTVLWLYLLIEAIIVESGGLDFVVKASVANLASILIYGLILGDIPTNKAFFRAFTVVLALLGASTIITTILSFFVSLNSLYIGHLPFKGYDNAGDIYFPFSVRYGFYPVGYTEVPRFTGLFREAGILQAFLLWGAVYSLNERFPKWFLVLILLGVVLTLSTTGLALLPATLLLWIMLRIRTDMIIKLGFGLASVAITTLVSLYTPAMGILSKDEVRQTSIMDRLEATTAGLSSALHNPFGVGMYGMLDVQNAGINLLAAMGQIGVPGFLLVVVMFLAPLIRTSNRAAYAVAVFPLFMTGLISEPLVDAPLVYVALFAYFSPSVQLKK